MAKKRKDDFAREEPRAAAEYYKLKTQAVDDLVNATQENSPPVSERELRKYTSGPRIHLTEWVKITLIKAWFSGMVCFFFLWGLGTYVPSQLDLLFIVGIALGFVTDLMVNPIFRYYAKTPGGNDRWMMFPKKGFVSLPLNVLYAFLLLFLVVTTYSVINAAVLAVTKAQDTIPLGVGPILFGLFATGWDMLLLGAKRLAGRIVGDARKNAGRPRSSRRI
ncbi:MAG: hypothetical protein IKQ41_02510 [Clostridia bacterium]|nr:hypothetical protein [Clostridia bacterium]